MMLLHEFCAALPCSLIIFPQIPPDDGQSELQLTPPAGHHIYRHDLESFFWSPVVDNPGCRPQEEARGSIIDEHFSDWKSNNLSENH